jgi:hypothetical protein
MERGAWTEERLDDLATSTREGFARVDQDIRDLRAEMNDGFKQLRSEIKDLGTELRAVMYRVGGGMMIGLLGVIVAILARGA